MVKQERAARTRQALIRAAAEAFAEEGFGPTSLSRISRLAGVSNGALHFHFGTKESLADAVGQEAAARVLRVMATAEAADDGLRALVDATHALMALLADDIVVRAGFELSGEPFGGVGVELRRHWQQWIEDLLVRVGLEGGLAEGVSPEKAAPVIVAATVGFEVLGCRDPEWLSEQKITCFWDLMLPRLADKGTSACAAPK